MKFISTQPQFVAQESISSKMLLANGLVKADSLPTIMSLYKQDAPLTALLELKNKKTKGINYSTSFVDSNGNFSGRYRTVSSNCVEYRIAKTDIPIIHVKANAAGETWIDDLNTSLSIGKGKNGFWIFLDSNVAGYKDIIMLADGETHLEIFNDPEPSSNGTWKCFVKVKSKFRQDSVNSALLANGVELQLIHTAHEQDFSERGNEYYSFGVTGKAYLGLQRVKFSYSGTAYAMDKGSKQNVYEVEHKGRRAFITEAEHAMLRKAAIFNENHLLEGRGTMSPELNKCVLSDENGREVLDGDGIMYSGDGPFRFPISSKGFTDAWFNSFMADIDQYITPGADGKREVVLMGGSRLRFSFNEFLIRKSLNRMVESVSWSDKDGNRGIVDTYNFYEFAGIRVIFLETRRFDERAGMVLSDGSKTNEWEGFVIPLGNTNSGQDGITLVQLRPTVTGTVAGIDKGGNIASSVDGTHTHMLWQNGVICMNQVFRIFRPWSNRVII
jgi:hypothetical protein